MLLHRHRLLREQSKAANQAAREALAAEHARRSEELERREAIAHVEPVSVEPKTGADASAAEVELPSSAADLRALDEAGLRSLAASLEIELDGRWGVGRVRREVAEALGIEI